MRKSSTARPTVLEIIEKEQVLQRIPVEQFGSLAFGRTKENDVVLKDKAISRRHFKLEQHDDSWHVVDLNSTNGVVLGNERLDPFVRTRWDGSEPLIVGPYLIALAATPGDRVQRSNELNGAAGRSLTAEAYAGELVSSATNDNSLVTIEPQELKVASTTDSVLTINIYNRSSRLQQFNILVNGIPQEWFTISAERAVVASNNMQTVQVVVRPTADAMRVEAGEMPFSVHIYGRSDQNLTASVRGILHVLPEHRFNLDVEESRQGNGAATIITVTNHGNVGDVYNIRAHDEQNALNFRARHWQMMLTPGTEANRRVLVKPKRQPLFGTPKAYPYSISVKSESGLKEVYEGLINVKPLISLQFLLALLALLVLGALSIWAATALAAEGTPLVAALLQLPRLLLNLLLA